MRNTLSVQTLNERGPSIVHAKASRTKVFNDKGRSKAVDLRATKTLRIPAACLYHDIANKSC